MTDEKPIAEKHNATLAQLATAWVIAQPDMTSAIGGARTPEQIIDIAKAADLNLSESDLQEMNVIGREVTDHFSKGSVNMWKWD